MDWWRAGLKNMLKTNELLLPIAPPLRKLFGPSFVLLGLGLGSGEIILWPYLAANYGVGIAWGAALGITFQYFINMEIERYSLARGESVFVGLARRSRVVPYWLIASTLLSFAWPGIIAASAFLFTAVFGGETTKLTVVLLLVIGVILSFGKYLYTTVEHFSKIIIGLGVPLVVALAMYLGHTDDWVGLALGVIGRGDGYWFLPAGIPLASFLAALAFSGAGGNLNLTQSSYIREKGYGMGHFMEKTKGLFSGEKQMVDLEGYTFSPTKENVARFRVWWQRVNREHALVFFLTGLVTMLLLILLSHATTFGLSGNASGIQFVVTEARVIGEHTFPWIGTVFAALMGLFLFSTELTVLDSTSRIMSENYAVLKNPNKARLSRDYYIFLWMQIIFGISIFLFGVDQPLTLLVIGAVMSALCMFVHIGLVNRLNVNELPKAIQPTLWRRVMIAVAFVFFGVFSSFTLWEALVK